jgi:hypothetical protein
VLPSDLGDQIPGALWLALNLRNVEEGTVTSRLRQTTDFTRVDAREFTTTERDLILGRVKDQTAWQRLPLHLDTDRTFDAIGDRCYLGSLPELPAGVEHNLRFIVTSDEFRPRAQFEPALDSGVVRGDRGGSGAGSARPEEHWRYILDQLAGPSWPSEYTTPVAAREAMGSAAVRRFHLARQRGSHSWFGGGHRRTIQEVRLRLRWRGLARRRSPCQRWLRKTWLKLFPEGQAALPALAQMMAPSA